MGTRSRSFDKKSKKRNRHSGNSSRSRRHHDENDIGKSRKSDDDRSRRKHVVTSSNREPHRPRRQHGDDDHSKSSCLSKEESSHVSVERKRKHSRSSRNHKREDSSRHHHDDDSDSRHRKKRKKSSSSNDRHKTHKHSSSSTTKKSSKSRKHSNRSNDSADNNTKSQQQRQTKLPKLDLGPVRGCPPDRNLDSKADYYTYHQHVNLFSYNTKGQRFSDCVTSKEQKEVFDEFCTEYNAGRLERVYYESESLPLPIRNQIQTTSHKWNLQTSSTDQKQLRLVQDGIQKQTEYNDNAMMCHPVNKSTNKDTEAAVSEQHDSKSAATDHLRRSRQEQRYHTNNLIEMQKEELGIHGGRKDQGSHERRLEKRREVADRTHGARRQEDGAELNDGELYGGDKEYAVAVARSKQHRQQRKQQQQSRIQELQGKEQAKHQHMLQQLGISTSKIGKDGKIHIAPRPS